MVRGELTQNVSTLYEAIKIFDEYYNRHCDRVSYVVLITYRLCLCKEKIKEELVNYRTYKVEGNYYEVKSNLVAWGEEKLEIYKLQDLNEVSCVKISIRTAPLIVRTITNKYLYKEYNNTVYALQRSEGLLQCCVTCITNKDWRNSRMYRNFKRKSLRNMSLEEQVTLLTPYFKKVVSKRKKYSQKFNVNVNNFINIIYSYDTTKIIKGAINVFQLNKGFYCVVSEGINISYNDQRVIAERKLVLYTSTVIITYDFEWNWELQPDGSYNSSVIKIITAVVYVPALKMLKKKIFTKNCASEFLSYITHIANYYEYKYSLKTYCISHNGSSVEHILLLNMFAQYIKNDNYSLKFKHVSGTKIYSFRWKNIEFRDSMLFCNTSLSCYAESMGVTNKKKLNVDWDNVCWDNCSDEMLEYAMQDSVVLMECIIAHNKIFSKIIGQYNIMWFDFKSGSSISKYYLLHDNKELMYNNKNISQQLIHYYYGGRNEVFFLGNNEQYKKVNNLQNIVGFKIDCNSSYPHKMTNEIVGNFLRIETTLSNVLKTESYALICTVTYLESYYKKYKFNLLCVKDKDNKLIFPNFNGGSAFVWDFEYEEIKEHIKVNIQQILVFERGYYYRQKMLNSYNARVNAQTKAEKEVRKFIMNGGYGSLGIKCERENLVLARGTHVNRTINKRNVNVYSVPNMNWKLINYVSVGNVCSIIQQASYITALGRFTLWKKMEEIEKLNYKVIYVDTDSVIAVSNMKDIVQLHTLIGEKLGEWKLEGVAKVWSVQGLKMYYFKTENETHIRCKGIGDPQVNENNMFNETQKVEVWERISKTFIKRRTVTKTLSFAYTKGYVKLNGHIVPLTYS